MSNVTEDQGFVDVPGRLCVPFNFSRRKDVLVFCHILGDRDAWMGLLRLMLWIAEQEDGGCVAEHLAALPVLTGINRAPIEIDRALRESGLVDAGGVFTEWHLYRPGMGTYPSWWDFTDRMGAYFSMLPERRKRTIGVIPVADAIPSDVKAAVFSRDGMVCRYCGEKADDGSPAELDHVVPRSRAGLNTVDNLVVSCRPCNRSKGARTPEEAGMTLREIPRKS